MERERNIVTKFHPNPLHRRGFLIASLLVTGLLASSCETHRTGKPTKILFVCQAGTAKSPIAREILKRRAKERGIRVDVLSRGIIVEDHVSPQLEANLRAAGIDTAIEPAKKLTYSDWATADILVNFNPLPASVKTPDIRDWTDVPSVNDDYANAMAVIKQRIDALLNEIANRK